ncbi:MAG: nitroreductase family protein [Haliangiales bacterium]
MARHGETGRGAIDDSGDMSRTQSPASRLHSPSRRQFLRGLGAAGATSLLVVGGCGYYVAESGDAYTPWEYPDDDAAPELLAVHAAILAANPHNTQPWLFAVTAAQIDVYADLSRSLGAMDSAHREMYIGLGCAIENLVIAARQHGREPTVTYLPGRAGDPDGDSAPGDGDGDSETWVARVELTPTDPARQALHPAIARRHTNRGQYLNEAPPAGLAAALRALMSPAEAELIELSLIADDDGKARFRDGTVAATQAIIDDHEMNEASHAWYRHSRDAIDQHRDGTTIDATGSDALTRALGKSIGRPDAAEAGEYWLAATRERQTTAAGFCLLSSRDRASRYQQLICGQVYQRMHLWATSEGLAMQPLNQMAERQDREQQLGLEPVFSDLLAELSGGDRGVQMLFRVGYAWDSANKSPRRPLAWVTL